MELAAAAAAALPGINFLVRLFSGLLKGLVSSMGEDESNAVKSCQGSPLFERMASPCDYVPMGGAVAAKAMSVQPQFVRRGR